MGMYTTRRRTGATATHLLEVQDAVEGGLADGQGPRSGGGHLVAIDDVVARSLAEVQVGAERHVEGVEHAVTLPVEDHQEVVQSVGPRDVLGVDLRAVSRRV